MTLILCIDDKCGMMFFGKRQSMDHLLREEIRKKAGKKTLFVSPYTAKQFETDDGLTVTPDPGRAGSEGDFVFLEDTPLPEEGVSRIILYKWNRHYPADRYLSPTPEEMGMKLTAARDFQGSSHETITEEIWEVTK